MKEIINGIHFEKTDIFIPWNVPLSSIKDYGHPNIVYNGGKTEIIWKNKSLLDGITGNWVTYYFSYEVDRTFKEIGLAFSGDKASLEAYSNIRQHLFKELGLPILQKEEDTDKELKWQIGNCYVFLYLFEMHAYRCTLTIGID